MKKSSKVISLVLAVLMAMSCFTGLSLFSASAADTTEIYFDLNVLPEDWGETNTVFCNIYQVNGPDYGFKDVGWQSKSEQCTFNKTTMIASYNIDKKMKSYLRDDCDYALNFSTKDKKGGQHQTCDITVGKECYGGTIYLNPDSMIENPVDSSKITVEGIWKEPELAAKYGASAGITSTGKVVGRYFQPHQPKPQIVSNWIHAYAMSPINGPFVTAESVDAICKDERLNVAKSDVYEQYASDWAEELADPVTYPGTASLDYLINVLDVKPAEVSTTEAPTTEAPTTEAPTTEAPTTEAPTTEAPTTEAPTTEAPTTEAPTTEAPTTEAPTTEAPTTEAPTTEAPTTEGGPLYGDVNGDHKIDVEDATLVQKAGIGLVELDALQTILANVNPDEDDVVDVLDATYIQKYVVGGFTNTALVGEPYVDTPAKDYTYVVAGTPGLTGAEWDSTGKVNVMEVVDGIATLTFTDVQPQEGAQFKIAIINNETGELTWVGVDGTDYNFTFNVDTACDITITYNPETNEVTYAGDGISEYVFKFDSIFAVGNGDGAWLNGIGWDPGAPENQMTEVSENVYSIAFEGIEKYEYYEVKFAFDGAWTNNFGIDKTAGITDFTNAPAKFNGDNITFPVANDNSKVTLTLDLTNFDYVTKQGATFTITAEEQEVQTTEAPTTEAPTTEAPTTEEPTTEQPTTEQPAPKYTYVVAGTTGLTGAEWDTSGKVNVMDVVDGIATLTFTDVQPQEGAQFKIAIINNETGELTWIGLDGTDYNFTFNVDTACDITITYNPETSEVTYAGDGISEYVFKFESISAVGNGDGAWLNGIGWDPAAPENVMTEVSENVYSITFEGIEKYEYYEVKFAFDGAWTNNFGYDKAAGITDFTNAPAKFNGDNITFPVANNNSKVTLTLDLTNFDYVTKQGATFTIAVEEQEVQTTEAPTTEEPTTEAPTTEEPTTEAPTTEEPTTEQPTTEQPAPKYTYVVAGTTGLTGAEWDSTGKVNVMEVVNGIATLTFTDVQPQEGAQFKIAIIDNETGELTWVGLDGTDYNFTFNVDTACDITITYNPETSEVTYAGDGISEYVFKFESISAVGNGDGVWLNGIGWDPAAPENVMTEVSENVYSIAFEGMEKYEYYEVKFAFDGAWTNNFGYDKAAGITDFTNAPAKFNGDNITFPVANNNSKVTLTLDLTNFDYVTKQGATFTIAVEEQKFVDPYEGERYTPSEAALAVGTRRVYFYMPDAWKNDATLDYVAGAYFYGGTDACKQINDATAPGPDWPGYKAQYEGAYGEGSVYYIDIPGDSTTVVWNNYVNGGMDAEDPIFDKAFQAFDATTEYYDEWENDLYPAGLGNEYDENGDPVGVNNVIYVIDDSRTNVSVTGKKTYGGDWYYYYGNGEYGIFPTRDEAVAHDAVFTTVFQNIDDVVANYVVTE